MPQLGRWLSRDPIGYEGGANLYEYCGGNPIMGLDPMGLDGNPLQLLIGEAKGFANFLSDYSAATGLVRLISGKNSAIFQASNNDQQDGDTTANSIAFIGDFFKG